MNYKVRVLKQEDIPFILGTWLKSYRKENKEVHNEIYFPNQTQKIKDLLNQSQIMLTINPEDEDHIYGYVVYQPIDQELNLIHYAYTKRTFRRFGIFNHMMNLISGGHPQVVTHITDYFKSLKDKYKLIYNPYLKEKS